MLVWPRGGTDTFELSEQHIQQEAATAPLLPSHELPRNAVFVLLPETCGDYNLINFHGKPQEL